MVTFEIGGTRVECESRPDLFSPKELDRGTRLLLEQIVNWEYTDVLDWGCGWGAMAIWLAAHRKSAKVLGLDSDIGAVKTAQANVERSRLAHVEIIASPGYEEIDTGQKFDLIVSNPPTHRGREVVETMIRESHERLIPGGKLVIVVEARLKPWVQRTLETEFGACKPLARSAKHVVLTASREA